MQIKSRNPVSLTPGSSFWPLNRGNAQRPKSETHTYPKNPLFPIFVFFLNNSLTRYELFWESQEQRRTSSARSFKIADLNCRLLNVARRPLH